MTSTTFTRSRLSLVIVAMAVIMFALVQANPAAAANTINIHVAGTARLDAGISAPCSSNIYSGTFTGNGSGTLNNAPFANVPVTASYLYCNSTTVAGTAAGTITVHFPAGSQSCGFSWTRTGTTAQLTFSGGCTGTAVAKFAPTSAPGAVPGTAVVTGAGTISN